MKLDARTQAWTLSMIHEMQRINADRMEKTAGAAGAGLGTLLGMERMMLGRQIANTASDVAAPVIAKAATRAAVPTSFLPPALQNLGGRIRGLPNQVSEAYANAGRKAYLGLNGMGNAKGWTAPIQRAAADAIQSRPETMLGAAIDPISLAGGTHPLDISNGLEAAMAGIAAGKAATRISPYAPRLANALQGGIPTIRAGVGRAIDTGMMPGLGLVGHLDNAANFLQHLA